MTYPRTERCGTALNLICKITHIIGPLKRRKWKRWNVSISRTLRSIHHCSSKHGEGEERTLGISKIFLLLGRMLENVIGKLSSVEQLNEAATSFKAELCHAASLKQSLYR